jgi:hypothetical protein
VVRPRLGVSFLEFIERMAHRFVSPRRGVIPIEFVGSDIINASFSGGRLSLKWPTPEKKHDYTYSALQGCGTIASIHGFSELVKAMVGSSCLLF